MTAQAAANDHASILSKRNLRVRMTTLVPTIVGCALSLTIAAKVLRVGGRWDAEAIRPYADVTKLTWFFVLAIGAAWLLRGDGIARAASRIPSIGLQIATFAIAFLLVHRMTLDAFHGFPQVQDEIAYDALARRIVRLDPAPRSHPLGEFFRVRFFVDDGRSYPVFQPGWPALLALFHRLHAATFAPAFASALLAVATFRLADRLYGRLEAIVATAILVCSPFYLYLGGAYFAHPLAATLGAVTLERLLASFEALENAAVARRRAIVGGLAFAWLAVTRGQIALALALPILVLSVSRALDSKRRFRLRPGARSVLVAFALAGSVGLVVQGAWNLRTTGRVFELPQSRYFALTESNPDCHRLGFGSDIGCRREHGSEVAPEGFPIARAFAVHEQRWQAFRNDAWGTPIVIALVALAIVRRPSYRGLVVATAVLGPVAVSFCFYYHAIAHGVRLWAESMPALAIAIAIGLVPSIEVPATKLSWVRRSLAAIGLVALLPLLVVGVCLDAPDRAKETGKDPHPPKVTQNLDQAGVHDAIVYMQNCDDPDRADVVYGWSSVLNANPPESGDRWLVRDFGPAHDRQMITMYPNRNHVRVDCNGAKATFLSALESPDFVVTEAEAKFPPDAQENAFVAIEKNNRASNHAVLALETRSPSAWVRFRQYLPRDGSWRVKVDLHDHLTLEIDGIAIAPGSATMLTAGEHVVTLRAVPSSVSFRSTIDRFEWARML